MIEIALVNAAKSKSCRTSYLDAGCVYRVFPVYQYNVLVVLEDVRLTYKLELLILCNKDKWH